MADISRNIFADHTVQTIGKCRETPSEHVCCFDITNIKAAYMLISLKMMSNFNPAKCHGTILSVIRQYIRKFNYPRDLP